MTGDRPSARIVAAPEAPYTRHPAQDALERLVYESWGRELSAGLAREGDAVFQLLASADLDEGFQAFHAKRPARFGGR